MNATDGSTDLSATFLSFAPCRVGQHAIFNWLMKHLSKQGTVSFYNNVKPRRFIKPPPDRTICCSSYQRFENGVEVVPYVEPHGPDPVLPVDEDAVYKFFSFEEMEINGVLDGVARSPFATGNLKFITILRDPYNYAASYIRFPIRNDFAKSSSLWMQIAGDMMGATELLPDDSTIRINYNKWKDSRSYRIELLKAFGVTIDVDPDEGVTEIAKAGRGSSFDGLPAGAKADGLKLDSRWILMREHPTWMKFISEEVNHVSRRIFGFDIEDLRKAEGLDRGQGPYHKIAHPKTEPLTTRNCTRRVDEFRTFLETSPLGDYDWHTKVPVTDTMKMVDGWQHVFSDRFNGRGIVLCAGGGKYMPLAWILVHNIRELGCDLPIQIWHKDYPHGSEAPKYYQDIFKEKFDDLVFINATDVRTQIPYRNLGGWEMKPYAIANSNFKEIIYMDADNNPLINVETLFDTDAYKETGALFWPDYGDMSDKPGSSRWKTIHEWLGCDWEVGATEQESGQLVINKERHWMPLQMTLWMNAFSDFWYKQIHGDKDTFHLAWRSLGAKFSMHPNLRNMEGRVMVQFDMEKRPIFQHRNMAKWNINGQNPKIPGYQRHNRAEELLAEFKAKVLEKGPLIP